MTRDKRARLPSEFQRGPLHAPDRTFDDVMAEIRERSAREYPVIRAELIRRYCSSAGPVEKPSGR